MHFSDETLIPSLSDETTLYHEVIPRTLLCRITSWDRGLDCHLLPLTESSLVTRLRLTAGWLTNRPIKSILESSAVRKVEYAAAKLACANYCNPANQARELINRFFEPVPPELLAAASTFRKMAFPVLRLMRQSESACDFMDSNPALLWAIACCVVEGSITPDHAAELVTGTHKKIARAVFGEQSTVTSAFLKKTVGNTFAFKEFEALKELAKTPVARKFFRHAESIDMEKLTQLPGSMHQLNHRCVQTWLKAEDSAIPFAQLMQQYEDSRHMARKLGEDCKKVVNKGMFFHAISSQHTRLANLVHRMEMAERGQSETHKPFPEPIIPGNENIIYLADAEALFKEGLAMSHCVHGAAAHAAMGWSNFYKVLWPERTTLEIAGVPGWARLEQMKLEYNREPAQATFDYIKRWIEEANTEYKTKRAKEHDETRTA